MLYLNKKGDVLHNFKSKEIIGVKTKFALKIEELKGFNVGY